MDNLASDVLSMLILTFVLGMKHGFDADHLATIDGLTRFNARSKPQIARYCGTLFSLGHGAVVVVIALTVSAMAAHWEISEWFGTLGAVISIGFLLALGILNLVAVISTHPAQIVRPVGLKGRLLSKSSQTSHPLLVALIGALFALSFDTLSQATFFALTANQYGGWEHALLFSLLFTLGMLVTDGINGLWIARLIAKADQIAIIASRVMGLVVSGISLLVAAFGAAKLFSPSLDQWSEGKELIFGFALVIVIASSFMMSMYLTRKATPA